MAPQDSFIDDEEDTCPLCIEEFDLSDRNFRPCPCGYQICQFCFNNLTSNLNGLCPACRRPYNEKDIQWKVVTHEEEAEFRANIQKNQKKRASEQRQKEVQKREAEKENRKNLQGVRVVQKNLVYVTGLTPTVREDELLKTLRKPEFFGQYGNIQKISISNRKSSDGQPQSLGIYVTFEKKEDAARCIQAVHGSQNGDRVLKAQLGTTKYCSAWLRHEQCGNRQCMFLHELGDEEDSYSRQDLSSLNSVHTQRPLSNAASSSRSTSRHQAPAPAPPAGAQPMARTSSKEGSDTGDGPILPASANWARTTQQRSRRGSHATSGAASSPAVSTSLPATAESAQESADTAAITEASASTSRKAEKSVVTDNSAKAGSSTAKAVPSTKQDLLDFSAIMKMLSSCPASAFIPPKHTSDSYPPLFDINGAERRRAMRDEDENRLAEQEEPVDNLEPSEGEPESGSLALGGEPEDRDQVHDSVRYDQRRNPAQPPIQRTGANDLFGANLSGYGQTSPSVGSIGNRTMALQQQLFVRPQSSFADQMPPGISSQPSSVFQGQGHGRQQSRFSFANENSSSSVNVKSAADPRYMAQQSSMMPSTYRTQPGSQLYPSSMPGPPPGLKSTGTPPIGGGMFGQGHSFGGSTFGAASKDNPSELLQSLIRGRGAGGSQAHDTGKLDLADPSILQARMQHQQQGNNAGVGQGIYGGQTQDDELLPLDESSVDALVADSYPLDERQPSFLGDGMRTPSVPHGLGFGHSHSPIQSGEGVSTTVPPARSGTTATPLKSPATPRPATPLVPKVATKPIISGAKDEILASGNEAKKGIKELAAKSGLSKDIAAHASSKSFKGKSVLQEEDFPALDSIKTASPPKITPALPSKPLQATKTASGKKTAGDTAGKTLLGKTVNKPEKRPVPGTLDIAAATKAVSHAGLGETTDGTDKSSNQASSSVTQPNKAQGASTLPTPTPTTASISASSPMAKAGPKTLRLVQTPKAETPPIYIPPAAAASIRAAGIGTSAHRPATPASENVSDTASIVSASISASRTSSPPPSSKIGSASVRATTKSQQRKQRKEASKEAAAHIAESKPAEPEVEIAPILGRKKKQKKEKKSASINRTSSRPETPIAAEWQADTSEPHKANNEPLSNGNDKIEKGAKDATLTVESPKAREQRGKDAKSPPRSPTAIDTSIRLNESTKTTVLTPDYVSHPSEPKQEQPMDEDIGDIPNLRDVLRAIVEGGELSDPEAASFFKSTQGYRSDSMGSAPIALPPTLKAIVTKEDEEKLIAFQPVRKTVNEHSVLLTPNGDCLLNLTEDEANLFLELQDRLRADSVRPTAFSAPRYAPATGFSLVKNRAVPNGTPSYFPSGPDNYPSDPVGKMHREEAISCINQHVLPSLNLSSYKAMGSNPNFGKNVNLQQLAPWIYPSSDNAEDQRKMFSGRAGDDFSHVSAGNSTADGAYPGYDNPDGGPSPAIGSTPLMSVEDAESAWSQAKKQHEVLDKKFRQLQTKNRRLVGLH
ncbi:hypothetical protein F4779DRAFT_582638 [Xylariaceae sp. FL0662B]|nr:hypothetical protein F4779DRAFT_582638 [Xylariaceae sp. FL0662B]